MSNLIILDIIREAIFFRKSDIVRLFFETPSLLKILISDLAFFGLTPPPLLWLGDQRQLNGER